MLKLLADENLDGRITRGLLRREPTLDIVRVQDVGLAETEDPTVLAWAAEAGRVPLTHDVRTIPSYAGQRVAAHQPMPGVFEVSHTMPLGQAIEEILVLAECSEEGDWEGQVIFLPL